MRQPGVPSSPWHSTTAFANTFRDLRDRSTTSLVTAALLAVPVALAPLAALSSTGGEIRFFAAKTTALAIALFITGELMSSLWAQFALIRATREYATGNDPGVGRSLGSIGDFRRFFSFLAAKLMYEGLKLAVLALVFLPAIGVLVFALQGARGNFERTLRGSIGVLFVLALVVGVVVYLVLLILIVLSMGLAPVVGALEEPGPLKAFRRSRQLLKGRKQDYFILLLLRQVTLQVIGLVVLGPVFFSQIASFTADPTSGPSFIGPASFMIPDAMAPALVLVLALGNFLYATARAPIMAGVLTNYYLGVRGDEVLASISPSPGGSGIIDAPAGEENQPDPAEQQNPTGQDQDPRNLTE